MGFEKLLFRKDVIDGNKEALIKLLKVYGQAGQELTANPDKYRALFIDKARVPAPIKDTYRSPVFSSPQVPSPDQVTQVINWMTNKKLLEKPFAYEEIVDTGLLQQK
ncbi:MAG: hypothetical protein M0Z31_03650 [Clostridia bacterium]|nr:hypothetical protein [Clostridia bacterium]